MNIFRNFVRLIEIFFILLFSGIFFINYGNKKNFGKKLTETLEKLGPTFIKFGQSLSTRPDIIGAEITEELCRLQDKLPEFEYTEVEKIFISEFEQSISEIFKSFDKKPIAAASIAQVHKAETFDGRIVAVKILRPNIEKIIRKDIDLFYFIAKLLETFAPFSRRLRPVKIVENFYESLMFEIDLRFEAAAASELRENLRNENDILIPKVFWDLTRKNILTIEWIEGVPISNRERIKELGFDLKDIAAKLAICFFDQAYRDGFFHADMHPGNIFVTNNGKIGLIDFGIMGRLDKKTKIYVAEILRGFLKHDYMHVAKIHFMAGYVKNDKSLANFAQACRSIGEPIVGLPVSKISVGKLLMQLFEITKKFDMEVQPQLLLLQKTTILVEGVGSSLDQDVNMWQLAEPWIEDWAIENLSIEAKIRDNVLDFITIFRNFPEYIQDIKHNMELEKNENRKKRRK